MPSSTTGWAAFAKGSNSWNDSRRLEAQIVESFDLLQRADMQSWCPLILLERADLARMRGDADAMARDLAETRRLFAEMGVIGWDDYARSIEA